MPNTNAMKKKMGQAVKGIFDRFAAVVLLIAMAPLMLLIGLLIRWMTSGPALFRQVRVGYREKPFTIYKFCSMRDARDPDGKPLPDGDRLTRIGRFLRRTSLDELPQLWNVLRGDLSLVGPRPLLVRYLPYYTERERLRHSVRPGITGWAQVHGRNLLGWDQRLEKDIWYVEHWSLRLDLAIILRTVRSVLLREGVVEDPRAEILDLDQDRRRSMMNSALGEGRLEDAVDIRLAVPDDAESIVSVLRSGLGESVSSLTIYGCHSVETFVRERIQSENHGRDFAYMVGLHEGEVIGCAEVGIGVHDLHINFISVLPDRQKLGIGRRLLREVVLRLREPSHTQVRLDVFENNCLARIWYSRLGFCTESSTLWYQGAVLDDGQSPEHYVVYDLPEALASLDTYGFGRFRLATPDRTYNMGILGDHWFRVTDIEAFHDPLVHRVLRAMDPGRDMIASWPQSNGAQGRTESVRMMGRSFRMATDLETLSMRLNRDMATEPASTTDRYSPVV